MFFSITALCISAFAQKAGDVYIGGTLGLSLTNTSTEKYDGGRPELTETGPLSAFSLHGDFGWFMGKNLCFALSVSLPVSTGPWREYGENWLYASTFAVNLNPHLVYYVKLMDRLYYTPAIGGILEVGRVYQQMPGATAVKKARGDAIYANVFAFEIKVTEKFAIGVNAGSLCYEMAKVSENNPKIYNKVDERGLIVNQGFIDFRYYLGRK